MFGITRLRCWILAAGLTWFSYAAGAAITNLISNGDFESGSLAGWSAGNGYAASTNLAHGGAWSARSTNADMNRSFSTVVGRQYKLAGWVRIASETGSDWGGFRLEAQSSSYASLAHSGYLTKSGYGTNWFKVAITFTATSSSSRFYVGYFGGSGRQMVVYVDDLMAFEKLATNNPPQISATLTPATLAGLPQALQYAVSGDDPDGAIKRVDWDFGDGAHSPELSGIRRVGVPGDYEARVRVTDDEGALVTQTLHWSATDDRFPTLTVAEPASGELVVSNALLTLSGSAGGTGVGVLVSTDRGYAAAAGGSAGAWSTAVPLQPGWNRVLVQARDGGGRIVTAERRVRWVPGDPLDIASLAETTNVVPRWETFEATFQLTNTAATHPHFPFDPAPPAGLEWVDGVTVDGLFTPDNWGTVYRRPAFLLQTYQRAAKGSEEWLYPQAPGPAWCVRFAPPEPGQWQYRIEAREAKGSAQSAARTFRVTAPVNPLNHGPVRVARNDARYFEFADGMPFFGPGHALGFSAERYSFDALDQFHQIGTNNQNFFRWWISGHLWGAAWQPWNSRTLGYSGYLPANGLSLENAYANGLASLKLSTNNPIMFQGWMSGHSGVVRGRTYRVRVRWRTENVTGPLTGGQPYGLCLKFTGWPEPGQTGSLPVLIPHVNSDTPWHVAETNFTATGDYLSNLAFILENCTGGVGYVDECGIYEVLAGGGLGPQLLRGGKFNSHLCFEPRRGAGIEAILTEAEQRGLYFKLVISEKDEWLVNRLGVGGLPDRAGGNFNNGPGTPAHRLHEYYWRYLFARLGASRAVHSWELVNEEAPSPGAHFRLTADLAQAAAADANPHPATTSTWSGLASSAWKDPASAPITYTDFHCYVRGTGWLTPKEELANDSARFFSEYDQAARAANFTKPVVWGEQGIDGTGGTDGQEPLLANDQTGVWLHKILWARCGSGGVYPLYWYNNYIFSKALHWQYGAWNRFMAEVPINNGHYVDLAATASHPDLRVLGQKDLTVGRAHLWIDNRKHTWRAVVAGTNVAAITGTVAVPMQTPHIAYKVEWYATTNGQVLYTEGIQADATGVVALPVTNLATDIAAKLFRTPVVLQSSPEVRGPYADDSVRIDPVLRTVSFARPNSTRFYRLRSETELKIGSVELDGTNVALTYE